MPRNLRLLTLGLILGIVLFFGLLMVLPVDLVYKVPVTAKVYAGKEWQLIQDRSDFHTRTVIRTQEDLVSEQSFVFQRGDVVNLDISSIAKDGSVVPKDSTLLVFQSRMLDLRIQQAMNERAIQFSSLRAGETAMKLPLYQEAQESVELAKANLELQNLNMERMNTLFSEGVISKAELDIQTNSFKVAEQELKMAERRLLSTTFENKPEDNEVFATRMTTAEKELEVLLAQEKAYRLKAPFTGVLSFHPEENVILSVKDNDTKSLVFPFPIHEKESLTSFSTLVMEQNGKTVAIPFNLKSETRMIGGKQYVLGSAMYESTSASIGEFHNAYVTGDTLSIGQYLLRKIAPVQ